jgi:hypothetical protein
MIRGSVSQSPAVVLSGELGLISDDQPPICAHR